ncbi:MAG: hypothetical protein PHC61_07650, partial [Chitinivibrionales bacterium]|nr:hypothetical protein [Chitinivibrionales bacterium]
MKKLFLLCLALATVAPASQLQYGSFPATTGEFADNYIIYVPKSYSPQKQWPLIVFLHGSGERGRDLTPIMNYAPNRFLEKHDDEPFIFV